MNIKSLLSGLIVVALVSITTPVPARAGSDGSRESNGWEAERPVRLYASARFGPIGFIKSSSFGDNYASIDGHSAQEQASIWGGELITVHGDGTLRIAFESLGEATLSRGTAVRFSSGRGTSNDLRHEVLIASLEQGRLDLRLSPRAGAYVEAPGSTYTAEPGASFGIDVRDARASLIKRAGVVSVQDQPIPQDVKIRMVDDLGRPVASGSQLSVRARSTRQVQVQVTDKNDKPLPDLPVLFSLGDPCLGSLGLGVAAGGTFRQKTDKRGIAAVPLVAGAARCAASILAKVEGTNASVSIQTNVVQNKGFWNTQNTLIVVGAAAAAGIITGVVVTNSSNEPIRAVPPPTIKP
jgi:hypothetical protein